MPWGDRTKHTYEYAAHHTLSLQEERQNIFTSMNASVATENKEPFIHLTGAPHFVYTYTSFPFMEKLRNGKKKHSSIRSN